MSWFLRSQLALRLLLLLVTVGICHGLGAQVTPSTSSPVLTAPSRTSRLSNNVGPGPGSDAVIHPDDVLDIYIMDVPEFTRQYRVSALGKILVPLLREPVAVAGMTTTKLAETLTEQLRLAGLVNEPHIMVTIVSSRVMSIAITGAVRRPQIYPVFGRTTLLDILSQAEGLDQDASGVAVITRGEIGESSAGTKPSQIVDLKKLLESGDSNYNVFLYPGDRVTVPRAGIVYVVGAVTRPGGYTIKPSSEGMTVLQAVAFAEGLKSTAKSDKTVIIRKDPAAPEGHRQIPLHLKQILAGKTEDASLQANDILFVPDSLGAKALRRGVESVLAVATGVAVYRY